MMSAGQHDIPQASATAEIDAAGELWGSIGTGPCEAHRVIARGALVGGGPVGDEAVLDVLAAGEVSHAAWTGATTRRAPPARIQICVHRVGAGRRWSVCLHALGQRGVAGSARSFRVSPVATAADVCRAEERGRRTARGRDEAKRSLVMSALPSWPSFRRPSCSVLFAAGQVELTAIREPVGTRCAPPRCRGRAVVGADPGGPCTAIRDAAGALTACGCWCAWHPVDDSAATATTSDLPMARAYLIVGHSSLRDRG